MTDVFSWGDSSPEDPYDDDSWMSEPESICNNWRGWKKTTPTNTVTSNNVNSHNTNHNNNNDNNGLNNNGSMASTSSGHQNHRYHYHHHHHHHHHHHQQNDHQNLHLPSSSGINNQQQSLRHRSLNPLSSSSTTTTAAATASSSLINTIKSTTNNHNRNVIIGSSSSTNNNHYNFNPSVSSLSSLYHSPAAAAAAAVFTSRSNQSDDDNDDDVYDDYNDITGINNTPLILMPCCNGGVPTLTELAARSVAYHISFEIVERVCSPVPEQLQLRIAYWSFADNEEDIRLYSCLANGSADEFQKGETLYRSNAVRKPLQIGFHLSATVSSPPSTKCTVAVTFDRCRITSCSCTCASPSSWCSHVVAVCLHRIYKPYTVRLRAPVSESLTRLSRDQLQKFAQYLISLSPQQILPTAQQLLDDLLLNENSIINKVRGAPDPTAGAPANEQTKWCLDELQLHGNIRKIVIKLCMPSPMVYSDVNYLSSAAPPAAAEWSSLLRPLRGREPEGLWNLLSIVREMLRRHDRNAIPLLRILTEELLSCDQILIWWFNTNVSLNRGIPPYSLSHHSGSNGGTNNGTGNNNGNGNNGSSSNNRSMHSNMYASQHACCSLCDEIVVLWRLVTLNPTHSYSDTQTLYNQLKEYHLKTLSAIYRFKPSSAIGYHHSNQNFRSLSSTNTQNNNAGNSKANNIINNANLNEKSNDLAIFSGFKPAMISCLVNWDSYPIPGVTHQKKSHHYYEQPSLHDQLNSVNHAITSTAVSMGLDRWPPPTTTASTEQSVNGQREFDFANNNDDDNVKKRRKHKNIGKDNCDSEDSGNQELWERYSNSSSSSSSRSGAENDNDDDNGNNNVENNAENNENLNKIDCEPGPSGLQQQQKAIESNEKNDSNDDDGENNEPKRAPNDDYQIYIYDHDNNSRNNFNSNDSNANRSNNDYEWDPILLEATVVKSIEDPFEILFARAEALYAHGYVKEACRLSVCLAEELLGNPPELQLDMTNQNVNNLTSDQTTSSSNQTMPASNRSHSKRINRIRFNPALHQISLLASATLSKAAFLCQVLSENEDTHLLAFQVGLFGLELIRPPASTKALEVKLAHQEQELVNLLKKIPLCPQALYVLREKAEQLRDGRITTRGEALLPLSLASYLFEAFILSTQIVSTQYRLKSDERLLFDAAVAAIGLKAKVSEAEHPLLCEGTRRQRGDLALQLLVHYKDNKQRLDLIMEKLLDQEIHPIFNSKKQQQQQQQSNNVVAQTNQNSSKSATATASIQQQQQPQPSSSSMNLQPKSTINDDTSITKEQSKQNNDEKWNVGVDVVDKFRKFNLQSNDDDDSNSNLESRNDNRNDKMKPDDDNDNNVLVDGTSTDNFPTVSRRNLFHRKGKTDSGGSDSSSSSNSSSGETISHSGHSSDSLSANFDNNKNCEINNDNNPSNETNSEQIPESRTSNDGVNQANAISTSTTPNRSDSTTSTVLAANQMNSTFSPGIQQESATKSTLTPLQKLYPYRTGYMYQLSTGQLNLSNSTVGHNGIQSLKPLRYKGKRHYPVIPNQPSEASAHFMFELAKTLLAKAGGNNTTVLFTQPPSTQNCRAPHRLLHMCAFQIGIYALGLHNAVAPNWLSRTYSSHVSWIGCQAMEIGHQAIEFLIDSWEGHLTPSEAAALSDRASRSQDPLMVKAAAELALSCLPHAHALTPSEIQRALIQCKEQSTEMLERACLSVEQAAQGGGVYPEVLFDVARKWYQLYINEKMNEMENVRKEMNNNNSNETCSDNNSFPQSSIQHSFIDLMSTTDPTSSILDSTLSQEFYDTHAANTPQGTFASIPIDQNNQIAFASGHPIQHHSLIDPSMAAAAAAAAYYQSSMLTGPSIYSPMADMNQYLFYQSQQQQQRNQLYQPRLFNNSNNNKNQQFKPQLSNYYQNNNRNTLPPPATTTTFIYDPQRGYVYGNGGQNSLAAFQTAAALTGSGFNLPQSTSQSSNSNVIMAGTQFFPTSSPALLTSPVVPNINSSGSIPVSGGSNQESSLNESSLFHSSNGNYFYPTPPQQSNTQSMMASSNANIPPYPFVTQFPPIHGGFMPQNFVAHHSNANARVGQGYRVLVMDQMAQHQPSTPTIAISTSSNNQTNVNNATVSQHPHHHHHHHNNHNNHHHHHHHQQINQSKTPTTIMTPRQFSYMHAAYRVGMLAMETLARRVNDDRPQAKFSRNPSYGEDVKWLLLVAKKLGTQYVQEFCFYTLSAVASPFVLYDIIVEAAQSIFQNANNNSAYIHSIRSHILTPLIHKCQMMFTSGIYFQLMNISSSDYDEFILTLRTARAVFQMIPGGHLQFNDLLQKLKRTKSCKKELWQHINNAMQLS